MMKELWDTDHPWEYNVKNCNIPVERSVMICDNPYDHHWFALDAGCLAESLNICKDTYSLHECGRWIWLQFDDVSDAVAFKLLWVE